MLIRTGQSDRANRLLNVAYGFLNQAGSLSVPENIHIQLVLGRLLTVRNETTLALSTTRAGSTCWINWL